MSLQEPSALPSARADEELFSKVSVGRTSQVIADQIRLLLRDGRLKPGDRLPSERDLCQRFGVSRVTVREALRVLEANGLIEIKVGARGGAIVSSPSSESLGEGLADLLTLSPFTASHVTEARLILELGLVPMVVERATEEDIAALRELADQGRRALNKGEYTVEMSAAFHIRLAGATRNPAIEMLVRSFHGPLVMSLEKAQHAAPRMGRRGVEEHRAIVDAVEARDVQRAADIMREHLERTAQRVAG